jgi:ABC transporter with metal-binding/Fe-S-binding domain ATP-binding protein
MHLASLLSGGKDSVYAMYLAMQEGHDIAVLISIASANPESYMFHVPNIHLTKLQAEAMEIPLIYRETEGVKEEELEDLKSALKEAIEAHEIDGIVSGAIFSNYQRSRIDDMAEELGLESLSPLWKRKPKDLLSDMVAKEFTIIITVVAAEGLGPEWLGVEINAKVIEELADLHNTCYVCTAGEGGEFETLVMDAPIFKKKITIIEAEKKWDGQSGAYIVRDAVLSDKEK